LRKCCLAISGFSEKCGSLRKEGFLSNAQTESRSDESDKGDEAYGTTMHAETKLRARRHSICFDADV
jgi:hypothetical protein